MENTDLIGLLENDPGTLSTHELLYLDYITHYAWKNKCEGLKQIHFELCSLAYLVGIHALVRQEMNARGFRHLISDTLEARSSALEQQRRTIEVGFIVRPAIGADFPGLDEMNPGESGD